LAWVVDVLIGRSLLSSAWPFLAFPGRRFLDLKVDVVCLETGELEWGLKSHGLWLIVVDRVCLVLQVKLVSERGLSAMHEG
jgi:hypothetical protein